MDIFVVAWEYGIDHCDGGGFDWYHTKLQADAAYKIEQNNEVSYADDGWRAYKFTVAVSDSLSGAAITSYIDNILVDRVNAIKKNA